MAITSIFDYKDYIDKIFNKIKLLIFQFVNISLEKITKILINKFYLINFNKFCHIIKCNNIY